MSTTITRHPIPGGNELRITRRRDTKPDLSVNIGAWIGSLSDSRLKAYIEMLRRNLTHHPEKRHRLEMAETTARKRGIL